MQRDQVESIAQQEVGEAAVVNSTSPTAEREEAFEALEQEEMDFLFLAPKQFNNSETWNACGMQNPPCLLLTKLTASASEVTISDLVTSDLVL
ncbi:hypothetical protein [Allocoleopsis sp.]|uniref:hypothetical protein n=1 Tax=Allocoleopsis sp. TaxID=3088169 RepID=UPI002FD732C5